MIFSFLRSYKTGDSVLSKVKGTTLTKGYRETDRFQIDRKVCLNLAVVWSFYDVKTLLKGLTRPGVTRVGGNLRHCKESHEN